MTSEENLRWTRIFLEYNENGVPRIENTEYLDRQWAVIGGVSDHVLIRNHLQRLFVSHC